MFLKISWPNDRQSEQITSRMTGGKCCFNYPVEVKNNSKKIIQRIIKTLISIIHRPTLTRRPVARQDSRLKSRLSIK